ncbi:Isochorismatase [Rhodovulum sp. PH10]|uniref:isochorismatase family protein n=1 Tax=Rhodovulum sp. PH10 TaxID=1187851 RepID=UPI00027C2240|nr:isochorismatase family protein [Rhodovulum sp. PH10]EJW10268.1 Isochorismatase [Rhodovulum sp. PH10]
MPVIDPRRTTLLVIDFQDRLMPAIEAGEVLVENARRLLAAAETLDIPVVVTEQNAKGLGATVAALPIDRARLVPKMTFDAVRAPGFLDGIPEDHALVVAGCEAHVCVCQTVLALRATGRTVHVVRDAVGSRKAESKETALARMARHGADVVTTEMVVFEWLETAEHPRFREMVRLIK